MQSLKLVMSQSSCTHSKYVTQLIVAHYLQKIEGESNGGIQQFGKFFTAASQHHVSVGSFLLFQQQNTAIGNLIFKRRTRVSLVTFRPLSPVLPNYAFTSTLKCFYKTHQLSRLLSLYTMYVTILEKMEFHFSVTFSKRKYLALFSIALAWFFVKISPQIPFCIIWSQSMIIHKKTSERAGVIFVQYQWRIISSSQGMHLIFRQSEACFHHQISRFKFDAMCAVIRAYEKFILDEKLGVRLKSDAN